MKTATRTPQRVLVIGGTSEIAAALVNEWLDAGVEDFVFTTRDGDDPQIAASIKRSGGTVSVERMDVLNRTSISGALDSVRSFGDLDVAVVALGSLISQERLEATPDMAWDLMTVNATATVVVGLELARRLREQGHGMIVLLSSVAGLRGRRDNYVYGASKAAVETFAEGLRQSLVGSGVQVLVARPGYVHSRMSRGIPPAPFSVTTQESAKAIARAIRDSREVVWIPPILAPIFAILRILPRSAWARLVRALRSG